MTKCPFCSDVLLRHIRAGKSYWLCRHCRLELSGKKSGHEIDLISKSLAAHHVNRDSLASGECVPSNLT